MVRSMDRITRKSQSLDRLSIKARSALTSHNKISTTVCVCNSPRIFSYMRPRDVSYLGERVRRVSCDCRLSTSSTTQRYENMFCLSGRCS